MKQEVQVPDVGESVSSGILAAWLKQTGEMVEEGEELFELETDKATLAVPSPSRGVLTVQVEEDTEVEVGQVVATIDTEASAKSAADSEGTPAEETPTEESAAGGAQADSASLSPAVRRVVEENKLDVSSIAGSGKDGRITKEDALKAVQQTSATDGKAPEEPAAKQMPAAKPSADRAERQVRKPMSNLRKRIAEKLVQSQQTAAHLTTFNEVDMSEVMDIRKSYRDEFEKKHGVRLGFMSFFLKASQKALADFPDVNAYVDGTDIIYNNFYDIGVALSSDRGLITPVVRDVDTKGFAEIEQEILGFIGRAKERRIMPDELSGGTFTISNGGVFGSLLSTPIPNPPQTAVLGMHSIQKRPVVDENDAVVVRPMMYLALTYDHRILDGKDAITFLRKIKILIEDPYQMLLEL